MLFGGLWMLLVWGLLIWALAWALSRFGGSQGRAPGTEETPLDIARKRFARGEIGREQFEEIRETLKN
jgi:putative membrane protein